eukprot:8423820-Karenia_brevis.AAC.1
MEVTSYSLRLRSGGQKVCRKCSYLSYSSGLPISAEQCSKYLAIRRQARAAGCRKHIVSFRVSTHDGIRGEQAWNLVRFACVGNTTHLRETAWTRQFTHIAEIIFFRKCAGRPTMTIFDSCLNS